MMYVIMSETFIKIDSLIRNTLKFQDEFSLRIDQKSALQHSLFGRYANFSKLMPTIHISMDSIHFNVSIVNVLYTSKVCNKSHTKMY